MVAFVKNKRSMTRTLHNCVFAKVHVFSLIYKYKSCLQRRENFTATTLKLLVLKQDRVCAEVKWVCFEHNENGMMP